MDTWIIGSDAKCDIVVNNPAVSGRHCRLQRSGAVWTLEDLQSTNGTYVNGERLIASRTVTTNDQITLGQSQPLPWPDSNKPAEKRPAKPAQQVITVGRGSDNDVVLTETNVSTRHVRFIIENDQILLEDLGSTNGTAVGSVENKINRSHVQLQDTVFFGSAEFKVADLLSRAAAPTAAKQPPSPLAAPKVRSEPTPATSSKLPLIAMVSIGVIAIAVAASMMLPKQGADPDSQNPASDPLTNATGAAGDGSESTTDSPPQELSEDERVARSLFAVVRTVKQVPMRVGTAFAIDAHHLATAADVVLDIQEATEDGERVYLYAPDSDAEIAIAGYVLHPQYVTSAGLARDAQQNYQSLYDSLEAKFAAADPAPEDLEAARERLLTAAMQAQEATDRVGDFVVAVIEVEAPLEHWLTLNTAATAVRPNLKVSVTGLPADREDHYFDPSVSLDPETIEGRVRQLLPAGDAPRRLLASGPPEQHAFDYRGSPVLNRQGEVIAIFSRVSLAPPYEEDPQPADTFDAPLIARIHECFAGASHPRTDR